MESELTPEKWQRVKRVFDDALALDPAGRAGIIDAACEGDGQLRAEVESLLAAHEDAGNRYEMPPISGDFAADAVFGAYRIVRRLGAGGMGSVYLAARADDQFRRLVAIKTIRPDLLDAATSITNGTLWRRSTTPISSACSMAARKTALRTWSWITSRASRSTSIAASAA
jgi:serine/threonine protein kinase